MSKEFPEMDRVLLKVDEATRQRHLDAISSEIRIVTTPRRRKLRFLAVGVALVLLLPVIALASDGAVPGDLLYPVKRAVEPIARIFVPNVAAESRVEEVETLLDRRNRTDDVTERVRDQVSDEPSPRANDETSTDDRIGVDSENVPQREVTTTTVEGTDSTQGRDRGDG